VAVQTRPHDAQDGAGEQDGEGRVRADEGGGEHGRHDMEGRRGGMGQRGEQDGDGTGEGAEDEGAEDEGAEDEGAEDEGAEATCPDMCAGLSVGLGVPPLARLSR